MFESFNKVGSIETLEQKLNELKTPSKSSYWQKLSDCCSKMSADQFNYVSNNEEVIQTKSQMMDAFNLYLFEKYKEEFASTDMFTKVCDDYLDKVIDVASNYSESITKTLDENEKLKAKIAKLEKELNNAKCNTKGT